MKIPQSPIFLIFLPSSRKFTPTVKLHVFYHFSYKKWHFQNYFFLDQDPVQSEDGDGLQLQAENSWRPHCQMINERQSQLMERMSEGPKGNLRSSSATSLLPQMIRPGRFSPLFPYLWNNIHNVSSSHFLRIQDRKKNICLSEFFFFFMESGI